MYHGIETLKNDHLAFIEMLMTSDGKKLELTPVHKRVLEMMRKGECFQLTPRFRGTFR